MCPNCHSSFGLTIQQQEAEEVLAGQLRCSGCGNVFPIVGGVPRMVPGEISQEKQATAEAFGYEWTHFTALSDQYRAEFLDWIWPIEEDFFRGKIVLDGGCGKGRHAYLASQFGAREVIAVDLSDAVDAAFANTRNLPNVHVVQADLFALPFSCQFDFAYSIGVIHHLPDPRQGFLSIVKHLKPGGKIAIWVYGREGNGWIVRLVNPLRTGITSRAPKFVTRIFSFALALPLYLALKLVYRPINRSKTLKPLSKFLFYNDYLADISRYSFAENYWNVFDHLVAPTAFYLTRAEVEEWLGAAKLDGGELSHKTGNSWRASGLIPPAAARKSESGVRNAGV